MNNSSFYSLDSIESEKQFLVMYVFFFSRRHILDALPMLGSNAAIAVMKDIILKNSVSQDVAHEWLLALSFIPRYLLQ
jgi:hypothetical protein